MSEPDHTNLKVGDLLASQAQYGSWTELHRIERVTPTQYVLRHGTRVRRDDLRIIGAGAWDWSSMWIPTERDFLAIRIRKAKDKLSALRVTESNVAAVEALLAQQQEEPK